MASAFHPDHMPEATSPEFFDLTPEERRALKGPVPSAAALEQLFRSYPFRYFMAKVKESARGAREGFFNGQEIPTSASSTREAYFTGVVQNARSVLDLQRRLWDEAKKNEKDDRDDTEAPTPTQPEDDPFGDGPVEGFSKPGSEA